MLEWITEHTYLFDLADFALTAGLSPRQLRVDLKYLFDDGYLDGLHFDLYWNDEEVWSMEGYGSPITELIGPGGEYDHELDWTPNAAYMPPLDGGYVRMPKEAGAVTAEMLRFLATIYLRVRFREKSTLHYKGTYHSLGAGEAIVSVGELAEELGVHREQVHRWAAYALRDGLLRRIPQGRDYRWQVVRYGRRPKACG